MKIQKNTKLARYATFNIGGKAEFFAAVKNVDELAGAVNFAKKNYLRILIIGGGSNILLPDRNIKGLVIKINIKGLAFKNNLVNVGAGEVWDRIVAKAVSKNLGGIENLSLIPGTVGGAVYQNIGAYGVELKEVLKSVQVLDIKSNSIIELSNDDCYFGYRDSIFQRSKGKNWIILGAKLKLTNNPAPKIIYPDLVKYFSGKASVTIQDMRRAIIKIRKSKLVYPAPGLGTAGSFFKNPVVTAPRFKRLVSRHPDIRGQSVGDGLVKLSAGLLIEKADWKGKRFKNVGVSAKHSLVLVAYEDAKAKDILKLAKSIQKSIKNEFKIDLEPEVKIIA